jgi:hypothetical protein
MASRKHGTKPNLKAQQRNAAKRSPQAQALESARYRQQVRPDKRPRFNLAAQVATLGADSLLPTDIYPAAPRTFGKRTHDESAEPYSREELIRDKAREDARTIDGENI